MLALLAHYRRLVACLAIALQGLGVVVGALGHSHHGDAACCTGSTCRAEDQNGHHGGKCSHGHSHAEHSSPAKGTEPDSEQRHPGAPADNCALCRHFSQPVSPVTLTIEVARCQRVEHAIVALEQRLVPATRPAHPARGPPATAV